MYRSPLKARSGKTENTFLYYHYRHAVRVPGTKFVSHSRITPSDVPGQIGWVTNENVKFWKVFGIVAQPLFKIFEESAVILDAHIKGKPYQYENMLPSPVVLQGIVKYDAILNEVEKAFKRIQK